MPSAPTTPAPQPMFNVTRVAGTEWDQGGVGQPGMPRQPRTPSRSPGWAATAAPSRPTATRPRSTSTSTWLRTLQRHRPSVRLDLGRQQRDRRIRPRLRLQRRHEPGVRGQFLVSASNNADWAPGTSYPDPLTISQSGWYTFKHSFRNDGGALEVDMTVIRQGKVLKTWTLSPAERHHRRRPARSAGTATAGSPPTTSRRSRSTTSPGSRTRRQDQQQLGEAGRLLTSRVEQRPGSPNGGPGPFASSSGPDRICRSTINLAIPRWDGQVSDHDVTPLACGSIQSDRAEASVMPLRLPPRFALRTPASANHARRSVHEAEPIEDLVDSGEARGTAPKPRDQWPGVMHGQHVHQGLATMRRILVSHPAHRNRGLPTEDPRVSVGSWKRGIHQLLYGRRHHHRTSFRHRLRRPGTDWLGRTCGPGPPHRRSGWTPASLRLASPDTGPWDPGRDPIATAHWPAAPQMRRRVRRMSCRQVAPRWRPG